MSTRLLRILLPWFIAFSISQVLWGVIRGAGDAVTPMWASIAITAFVRIPLAYLLVHLMARPEAIIYGMIAAWGSHTVVSALAYRAGKWRTKGVVRKRPPENGPEEEAKGNGEEEAEAVPAMKIKTFNANPMGQNIYLYYDETANEGVLIDGGSDAADMASLASFIRESDITVRAVLLTHGHFDHITAVGEIKTLTSAPVYCHEAEKEMLGDAELNFSARMGTQTEITPDGLINDGDILRFGKIALEVRHTPGHTPGGVCYLDEANGVLFTGDTLFRESVGRTDFPTGDHQALIGNIKEKLLTLPGEVTVWPGHGPSTTVGHERNRNPYTLE
jgi:glyoxylase-like metal-dependent hydrolase (beta-lactamase superfamily II)